MQLMIWTVRGLSIISIWMFGAVEVEEREEGEEERCKLARVIVNGRDLLFWEGFDVIWRLWNVGLVSVVYFFCLFVLFFKGGERERETNLGI